MAIWLGALILRGRVAVVGIAPPPLVLQCNCLCNALANRLIDPSATLSTPEHCPRGTLDDFLSSSGAFFEAYRTEPHIALYDVEWAVEKSADAYGQK